MKILLIQLRQIGDVLMTTPAIRVLRETYPQAEIIFLTERPSNQLLQLNPYLNKVWIYEKSQNIIEIGKFLQKIRKYRFDCVVDFFGNPRSAWITKISGAKRRIGFSFRGRKWFYTDPIELPKTPHYAAFDKIHLLSPLGVSQPDHWDLDFFIDEEHRRKVDQIFHKLQIFYHDRIVSVSPVSRQVYKVWPAPNFAKIADWLIQEYDAKVLLLYGPGEKHFVNSVQKEMKCIPRISAQSTLTETRALFEKVSFHIGNDNGPCHIAIAAKTPTVAVFGKSHPINWTPPNQKKHLAIESDPGCKMNCTYPQCSHLNCINQVSVAAVKLAVQKLAQQIWQS